MKTGVPVLDGLLRFFFGQLVPPDEPAWQVLMNLKDIIGLVVAPVHTTESIAYLQSKIRSRLQEVFPGIKLLPKHHYVNHYPDDQISGLLVGMWMLRFEAKHIFFKQVTHTFL